MESQFWSDWVRPALKGFDPRRVETSEADGIPDVNYIEGWIELKDHSEWPKREETPLRIEHYTQQQKTWAIARCHRGGRCHLLIRVGTEALLFRGDVAAKYLGNSTKSQLREVAVAIFRSKEELKNGLVPALSK